MSEYQGHHCWNCWNVALWIANDEGLYRAALDAKRRHKTRGGAVRELLNDLPRNTPDGGRYTFKAVSTALVDLE